MPVRPTIWPVLAGIVAFPLLQFGLPTQVGLLPVALVATIAAYLLAIWLFRAVAVAALRGCRVRLLMAGFVAAVAAVAVTPLAHVHAALASTVVIPISGIVIAWAISRGRGSLKAYLLGAATVAVAGLIMYAPQWDILMVGFRTVGEENVSFLKQSMTAMGYHAGAADEYALQFQRLWNATVRVLPALTVMSLVTQFSVGFLWFVVRPGAVSGAPIGLEPFTRWKVPFGLTPILLVAVVGRLVGGDAVALVADNILLVLSIYYCVGGLALVEYGLQRIKIPTIVKVMFYVMLTLMGVLGYVVTVLLGFIDSFADWRKVNRPPIELKTG